MLGREQVPVIRHKVKVQGLSIRRVARELGISRNTVKEGPGGVGAEAARGETAEAAGVDERHGADRRAAG